MLGLLYFILIGLSVKFSFSISDNILFEYKLEGVTIMKMIVLCFMVGNCVCGVFSQLKERVCGLNIIIINMRLDTSRANNPSAPPI